MTLIICFIPWNAIGRNEIENQINSDDIVFVWIVVGGAGGAASEVGKGI